jgi:sulfur-oxidizing protein SoxY
MRRAQSGLSRRQAVATLGLGGLAVSLLPRDATAAVEDARRLLGSLIKSQPKPGKVSIKTNDIAENGNTVPVTVSVESPMTAADHVRAIHVISDGNPAPGVASFHLTPASGKAEVYFRMRMAQTQNLIAVAELNDGSAWIVSREVRVTIGGCAS